MGAFLPYEDAELLVGTEGPADRVEKFLLTWLVGPKGVAEQVGTFFAQDLLAFLARLARVAAVAERHAKGVRIMAQHAAHMPDERFVSHEHQLHVHTRWLTISGHSSLVV